MNFYYPPAFTKSGNPKGPGGSWPPASPDAMGYPPGEPVRDADEQRSQWDRVAAGWQTWWRTIEDAAQPVSRRMLALAAVAPGQRVLDIATGIGEPALLAARRVGPQGRVVATDIAPAMLEIARERARSLGSRRS